MVPLSGSPLFSISQGFRIVAYTAASINHTPRRLAEQIVRLPELVRIAKGIEPGEA